MRNRWVFALSMAVLWGIVFASALNDVTIGIVMGLFMGMAFGLFDCTGDSRGIDKNKESSERNE